MNQDHTKTWTGLGEVKTDLMTYAGKQTTRVNSVVRLSLTLVILSHTDVYTLVENLSAVNIVARSSATGVN